MSTIHPRVAVQKKWFFAFYWIGVIMSILCFGLALARNTELISNLQPANFPLSWAAGVIAVIAFLASEFCHPAASANDPVEDRQQPESPAWGTEFAD